MFEDQILLPGAMFHCHDCSKKGQRDKRMHLSLVARTRSAARVVRVSWRAEEVSVLDRNQALGPGLEINCQQKKQIDNNEHWLWVKGQNQDTLV